MDTMIETLRARQDELLEQSQTIVATATSEKRDMSVEEGQQVDGLTAEFERVGLEIGRREKIMAQEELLNAPRGRKTDPDPIEDAPGTMMVPAEALRPQNPGRPQNVAQSAPAYPQPRRSVINGNGGFHSFGDFAVAVKNANPRFGYEPDKRLIRGAAATTYSQETVGADGGFSVPPDFRAAILSKVFSEDSLIGRTDRLQSSSNQITIPIDMTTPWQTSGGILAFWVAEAAVKTQSKVVLEQISVKLNNVAVLCPVTEELLEDSPALDGYLRRKVPEKLDFTISNAIVRGTGTGQPLGFLAAPCLVTQTAEAGQTVDTVNVTNVFKMFSRMPTNSRSTAVWLIHPDVEPQLLGAMMPGGTFPAYLPPGGISASPYGTLLGRPVIPHQACETVGDLGDIMFVDLQQYMSVVKTGSGRDAGGLRTDVSIHLWFDQDLVAYRFTIRVGGMPWWSAATASRDGTFTQSPFVSLAAR